ncbi:ArsR family transcriptional regulator [Actinomadura alba]|uniref:Helix-turn-helix transcriptional regulator n=1 Tax=Actinomadura alba TaxID=406431 RepID=A0ABR7LRT2_9ACTN|nr:helix-turn-helix transcriptional regulator [Actinomadura alba]
MATYRVDTRGALGDPTWRAVFEIPGSAPKSVRELAEALPVSRPTVSQHLKVRKESGLVTKRAGRAHRDHATRLDQRVRR